MRMIFGGTARRLGQFGEVTSGQVIEMTAAEAAYVSGDSNFALHPSELQLGLHSQQCLDKTGNYTVTTDDNRKIILVTGDPCTITLPASRDLGFFVHVWDRNGAEANPITIDPGSECFCTLLMWVASVTVAAAGTGFTSVPTVEFSGDGVGAAGTAKLKAVGAAIQAGGTGYSVNDVLTIVGGTSTTAITLTVASVSGGVITGVTISQAGSYSALPSNPASVTGGAGTGATFNLTWGVASVTMTEKGFGYSVAPTATIVGGAGTGATLTPVVAPAKRELNQDFDKMGFFWDGTLWVEF